MFTFYSILTKVTLIRSRSSVFLVLHNGLSTVKDIEDFTLLCDANVFCEFLLAIKAENEYGEVINARLPYQVVLTNCYLEF